jgi:WD40 repeat protein
MALTGSADLTARLWDLAPNTDSNGKELRRIENQQGSRISVFSADGKWIVTGGGARTLRVWSVATMKEVRRLDPPPGPVSSLNISRDGRIVFASCGEWGGAGLFDWASGKMLRTLETSAKSGAISNNGKLAVTISGTSIQVWDVATGQHYGGTERYIGPLTGVAFHPDGRRLVASSYNGKVCTFDLDTAEVMNCIEEAGEVHSMGLAPDGRTVATGGKDKIVRVWTVR